DSDVGERGLHQNGGYVAVGEFAFEAVEVVELGDTAGLGDRDRRADVTGARRALAVGRGDDQRLVDGAVVAVAVEKDLLAAGDGAGQPDGPAVGVGGGQREGPAGQSEAAREVRARDVGLFGRQHHREAAEVLDPAA